MANGVPFETALEYLKVSFEEKLKDLERDFISIRMDFGSQLQEVRRDGRQIVERQYEFEKAVAAGRSEFEKGIDARIENIETLLGRLNTTAKWFAGTALSIAGIVATSFVLRWLGL